MPKIKQALRILFLLIFVFSCLAAFPHTLKADTLKWSRVAIPANGVSGRWVLAEGSDLGCLTRASDGALYCSANPASTPYRLFKSTDGGHSWGYTGRVEENIVDIAVIPDNPLGVYYATSSKVYKSGDAGNNFVLLAANPGDAGTGNIEITSLDVTSANGLTCLALGLQDKDKAELGGAYTLIESQSENWQECGAGPCDVLKVAFSPHFYTDGQLTLIGTDENDTLISSGSIGGNWGLSVGEARLNGVIPISADIAFPSDFDSSPESGKYTQYISLDSGDGQGGVFRLQGQATPAYSALTSLNIGGSKAVDISSLAVSGNSAGAKLLAGSAASPLTYFSQDGGLSWSTALKPPSGNFVSDVLMEADNATGQPLYAVTGGPESAFSVSLDNGTTWNQSGLIDTRISTLRDLAASPHYSQDASLFLLTSDVQDSLWFSSDGGAGWQRILTTSTSQTERIKRILLSPHYAENATLLLAGSSGGVPVFWKSRDNGRLFTRTPSVDFETGNAVNIDAWTITPGDVLFVGSFDGTRSLVYQTAPDSLTYIDKGAAGNLFIYCLALSPDYDHDHSLLAGNIQGSVFFSEDNGRVFEPLPFDVDEPPFSGKITVAFDAGFPHNKMVFAADAASGRGLYRFVIGESSEWQSIPGGPPGEAEFDAISVSSEGGLYALNLQNVDSTRDEGGIVRCLNPASSSPVFETINAGLDNGINLKKLWQQGNCLWTTDASNTRLLTYTDSLGSPVTLVSPADGAHCLNSDNIILTWEALDGATAYQWQLDTDSLFEITDSAGETDAARLSLTSLETNNTYFWRVRASQPCASPWSPVRSFDTFYIDAPTLNQPASSGTASIEPVFKWSLVQGADQYELRVSENDTFCDSVINRLCSVNVWQCDTALKYSTSYYWRVRAVKGEISSEWSAVNLFSTEAEPAPAPALKSPKPASPVSSSSAEIQPVFRWDLVDNASQYQLVVSSNDAFSPLIIDQLCNSNAWKSEITLAYQTAYYWKVRALNGDLQSNWSDVNVFTTRTAPSSGGSGSPSGGGSSSRTPTPTPSPTPTLTPTPTPTPSPSPTPLASTAPAVPSPTPVVTPRPADSPVPPAAAPTEVASLKTDLAARTPDSVYASPAPELTTSPPVNPLPMETAAASPASASNSILYAVVGGLVVLAALLIAALIFLLKKFKPL